MFVINNLKIKSKISIVFIFAILIEGILFALTYKNLGNITSTSESQNDRIIVLLCFIVIILSLSLLLINLICKPLKKLSDIAKGIENGNVNEIIDVKSNDEIGELFNSLNIISKNINNLVDDSSFIRKSIGNGNLSINLDDSKYNGAWKDILENNLITTNIFINNIRTTSDYISKVGKGEISTKYNEEEVGEFNVIKDNINNLIDNLNIFFSDILWLRKTFKDGNTRDKIDVSKYQGIYQDMAGCINDTIWISIDIFIKLFAVLKAYSKGDFSVELEKFPGRYGLVNEHVEELRSNLLNISIEQINIANEIKQGNLCKRADVSKFSGSWAEVIEGINGLIEAFIKPINLTADCVDRIGKGDIPEKITDEYHGEFNKTKNNLNNCIDNVMALVIDVNMLSKAAAEGRLDIRVDETKHNGEFKSIVKGINELIEEMVKPIREITKIMGEISKGNLDIPVSHEYKGEFGVLAKAVNSTENVLKGVVGEIDKIIGRISDGDIDIDNIKEFDGNFKSISISLNKIVDSLNAVLREINTAAEQVYSGAGQVADGSQALSQGATEQASSIEELTASITQVAAQTKENSVNANEAKELALKVKENAEEGNRHMGEMLKSMNEINESSSNISKIIKVIDEIAFQTNILALNAAVEAARAGQHGKGFAVVAEEVRNLAARSANAAKETTTLIEGSIKKSERGTEIANNTAKALYEIVDGVSKAATLVTEIAAASEEQATGIAQINVGIEQVSHVVQTNSATAEQSAAASEELSSQSELLKDMVSGFKLKNSNGSRLTNAAKSYRDKNNYNMKNNAAHWEVAATANNFRIDLNDNDFGKY